MEFPTKKQVKLQKERYPKGTTVRCIEFNDPYTRIPSGTLGKVLFVDDIGTVHIRWENGSRLGACIEGGDRIEVVK